MGIFICDFERFPWILRRVFLGVPVPKETESIIQGESFWR